MIFNIKLGGKKWAKISIISLKININIDIHRFSTKNRHLSTVIRFRVEIIFTFILMNKPQELYKLSYLPSISSCFKLVENGSIIIASNHLWQKANHFNQTTIVGCNGPIKLSIPIKGGRGVKESYDKLQISYAENWQIKHWRSIFSAYGSAPFFEHYSHYFEPFFDKKNRIDLLFDFNLSLLKVISKILQIESDFQFSTFEKSTLIVDDKSIKEVRYHQVFEQKIGFIKNASVIDLIFNEGPEAKRILRK